MSRKKNIVENEVVIDESFIMGDELIDEEKVDEKTLRQEKMLIYLLANYPNESYKRISSVADVSLIKDKRKSLS